jgi:hypothetical protein
MTQSTFTFKQPTTIEILLVLESDNIRLMSPESGDGIQPPSPKSSQPRFRPERPDLAREPDFGRLAGIRLSQIPTKLSGFRHLSRILAILAGIR